MTTALYPAHIFQKENVFYVQFVDLENGFTYGETLEDAKDMAADVLSALLASYIDHNENIPEPTEFSTEEIARKNIFLIPPDAKVQAALLLRKARSSVSQSKIADVMGTTWQAYQKIELPTSNTTLSKLQKAARALGRRLVIGLI